MHDVQQVLDMYRRDQRYKDSKSEEEAEGSQTNTIYADVVTPTSEDQRRAEHSPLRREACKEWRGKWLPSLRSSSDEDSLTFQLRRLKSKIHTQRELFEVRQVVETLVGFLPSCKAVSIVTVSSLAD